MIKTNVNDFLEKIEPEDVAKEYLSVEELYCLAETPCKIPVLKTASLFSCLTSLRLSDILSLCWEEIVDFAAGGKCVHTITQKTKTEDTVSYTHLGLYGSLRPYHGRRANARRRAGHGIPGAPFLYGRRRRRNLVPRFAVHRHRNAAPADRRRRTHGPTGRIHHPGLSCGQTRPLAGRSRGRHHRLVLAGVARARRQPCLLYTSSPFRRRSARSIM